MDNYRIESRLEVNTYLAKLKYALAHGARIAFQEERRIDHFKDIQFTNKYTLAFLFSG